MRKSTTDKIQALLFMLRQKYNRYIINKLSKKLITLKK